jgi:hypothetical protein
MASEPGSTIDETRALVLLRQVVAGREDFVYHVGESERCLYMQGGEPSCVVGHALALAGIPLSEIAGLDGGDDPEASVPAQDLSDVLESVAPAAAWLFGAAQEAQDAGQPWRVALAAAEERATSDPYDDEDGPEWTEGVTP